MLSKSHSDNGPEIRCVSWQMASLCMFSCHSGVTTRPICLNTHHNFVQLSQWGNYTSNLFKNTPQLSGIHPPGLLHCGLCVGGGGLILCTQTHTQICWSQNMNMIVKPRQYSRRTRLASSSINKCTQAVVSSSLVSKLLCQNLVIFIYMRDVHGSNYGWAYRDARAELPGM